MNQPKLKLCFVVLLCLGFTSMQAQETVLSSGGDAIGSGGSASYSISQVVYTTNTGTNGSVAQGVQQAYEISIIIEIQQSNGIKLECNAYPNPTSKYLTLKIDDSTLSNTQSLNFQLYDINGKLLQSSKITDFETEIEMSNLAPSHYLLKVTNNNQEVKTFKIIKN